MDTDVSYVRVDKTEFCDETDASYRKLMTSSVTLMEEFEIEWRADLGNYLRKFVEFCSSKALCQMCQFVRESLTDGSFS
ncbi:hypothetical protein SAY86_001370 [Trapa natans]|uniref:Uncharacterized protein n=1 Tax=Trapa natans TaxID=22666 RepID=A0AAN7MR00_TRANT|nr:hypothetical protein SAY86_001370 [Trapa natans]